MPITLQNVTSNGNTTTDDIIIGSNLHMIDQVSGAYASISTQHQTNNVNLFTGDLDGTIATNENVFPIVAGMIQSAFNGVVLSSGVGSPIGTIVGNVGDIYIDTNGMPGLVLWIKELDNGLTSGWNPK